MNVFSEPLRELRDYNILKEWLESANASGQTGSLLADSCVDPQKAHLLYALCREETIAEYARLRLVLTYSDLRAREIAQDCLFYDKNVAVFPARDLIFYQADPGQSPQGKCSGNRKTGYCGLIRDGGQAGLHGL